MIHLILSSFNFFCQILTNRFRNNQHQRGKNYGFQNLGIGYKIKILYVSHICIFLSFCYELNNWIISFCVLMMKWIVMLTDSPMSFQVQSMKFYLHKKGF